MSAPCLPSPPPKASADPLAAPQTLVANDISDFCIWGPGGTAKDNILGDIEGATVAWCIDGEKYGARTIPPGAITGLQFMRTPAYIQWTGHINVEMLNFAADDTGGELDPHGADLVSCARERACRGQLLIFTSPASTAR